ncbi:MAG: prepilin-type N-terminal cleavage/methylation domain-containing protein [Desulfobacterales bacterium]|jgi:Tfp pilus assembly major pilin PilA
MEVRFSKLNQEGFTLIELISIMIILGVLVSVALRKYENLTSTASMQTLAIAVIELNVRESLIWANMKISNDGYKMDEDVFVTLDKNLGPKLKWNPLPTIDGGTLHFESHSISLNRTPSTSSAPGRWN